jgi:hypothetical protein
MMALFQYGMKHICTTEHVGLCFYEIRILKHFHIHLYKGGPIKPVARGLYDASRRNLKWESLFQLFPWQSQNKKLKQFCKHVLFMDTYIILLINFV